MLSLCDQFPICESSLPVYYSTSSARYHTRPCMYQVNKIICPVSSDCLLCHEGAHEWRYFYNIEWSPNSEAWARSLVGGEATSEGIGVGWGWEESIVKREREDGQIVNPLRAWVWAAPSSSSPTGRSRGYISQAAPVVSNRDQFLINRDQKGHAWEV